MIARLSRYLLALLVLVGLIIGATYTLLATTAGNRWLLQQALPLAQEAGIDLQVGTLNGSILNELELESLAVRSDTYQVTVDRLSLKLRLSELLQHTLQIEQLGITGANITLTPAADTESEQPLPLQLPELMLPLKIQLDQLQLQQLELVTGEQRIQIDEASLGARLDADRWSIHDFSLKAPALTLAGKLQLAPTAPHTLDAQLNAKGELPETGPVNAELVLSGQVLQPSFILDLTTQGQLHTEGSLDLTGTQPLVDLQARFSDLGWPLVGPATVKAPSGTLSLRGSADDYRFSYSGKVEGPQIPPLQIQLDARGDQQQLTEHQLKIKGLDGTLSTQGNIRWLPEVRWDLALQARGINPGKLLPEWPSILNTDTHLKGGLSDTGYEIDAQISKLYGQLHDYPLNGRGGVYYHDGKVRFSDVEINSGPNRVQVNGRADTQLDLSVVIDAPKLNALYPPAQGQLHGAITLTGSTSAPNADIALQGQALAFDQFTTENLDVNATWNPAQANGRIEATGLQFQDQRLERAAVTLEGTPEQHLIDLAVDHLQGALALSAQGGLVAERWQGTVETASIQAPLWDEWALSQPVKLSLGQDAVRTSELCLQQTAGTGRLCATTLWSALKGVELAADLHTLPLGPINSFLSGTAQVEGALSGTLALSGQPDNLSATVALRPTDGAIQLSTDEETLQIPYRDVMVDAQLKNGQTTARAALKLSADGQAEGSFKLGPAPKQPISGSIQASFPDLRLLEGFAPAVEGLSGQLQLALNVDGTLQDPRLAGQLALKDVRAQLPAAGLELSAPRIQLTGNNNRILTLSGEVHSGTGKLDLSGEIDPMAAKGPRLNLRVKGENFQAVRLPEARVEISPDLELVGTPPYHLSGTLAVPTAKIELRELPAGAVSVSDDEIIANEAPPPPPANNLTAAVQVRLGEQVSFKGFGLTTRLSGTLNAAKDASGNSAYGKIDLYEGLYKAYGQNLKIEQGRLLFAGPVDNPDVDLRAVRVSKDGQVQAYLTLNGPVARPDLRVSSTPALPEAEALAYLLTGRGLSQAGKQEGLDIASAAISLGLSRSEPLLQKMGDRLGLDDLRLADNGNGSNGSSLLLGKYLRPDLYLGYLQNLFAPQGVALLRLHLSDKLDLETRAGTTQSIDLLYRREYD